MTKAQRVVWNWQILTYHADAGRITLHRFSDLHVRLTRFRDGRQMDFWPSTNKAAWLGFDKLTVFTIRCLDRYIEDKFN